MTVFAVLEHFDDFGVFFVLEVSGDAVGFVSVETTGGRPPGSPCGQPHEMRSGNSLINIYYYTLFDLTAQGCLYSIK